jgi:hypothetical protein
MDMLTKEEKGAIARFLHKESKWYIYVFEVGVYLLPSVFFAAYALIKQDFIAALVAYAALFSTVFFYLFYSSKFYKALSSAVLKYEEKVKALNPDE